MIDETKNEYCGRGHNFWEGFSCKPLEEDRGIKGYSCEFCGVYYEDKPRCNKCEVFYDDEK